MLPVKSQPLIYSQQINLTENPTKRRKSKNFKLSEWLLRHNLCPLVRLKISTKNIPAPNIYSIFRDRQSRIYYRVNMAFKCFSACLEVQKRSRNSRSSEFWALFSEFRRADLYGFHRAPSPAYLQFFPVFLQPSRNAYRI